MSGRFVLLHEWSISAGNTDNECKHLLKSSPYTPKRKERSYRYFILSFFKLLKMYIFNYPLITECQK